MNDVRERVIQTISRVLRLDEAERAMLYQEVGYKQLQKWTSARHAEIIVALEDEFGLEIEGKDIPRLNDVPKIVAYFGSRT